MDDRRRQRRSLGVPADKRWGVVLNPGVLRGGIQRNMVVAAESEGEGERARVVRVTTPGVVTMYSSV